MLQLCIAQFNWVYILDIGLVIALAIFGFIDAKRGFISVFVFFVSTAVSVILALLLAKGLQVITFGLFGLEGVIAEGLSNAFAGVQGMNIDVSVIPLEQLGSLGLPSFIYDKVAPLIATGSVAEGTTLAMLVGGILAQFIILSICAVLIFLIVKLSFLLLKNALENAAESITFVDKANRILGLLVGVSKVLVCTYAALALLSLLALAAPSISEFFDQCLILNFMYDYNPIIGIFGIFIS